jgi:hypothetical protein
MYFAVKNFFTNSITISVSYSLQENTSRYIAVPPLPSSGTKCAQMFDVSIGYHIDVTHKFFSKSIDVSVVSDLTLV